MIYDDVPGDDDNPSQKGTKKAIDMKQRNDPWAALYELMGKEIPKNEKERIAARLIGKGYSLSDARERSGLTNEEFQTFFERLSKFENKVICSSPDNF
ncbi:MAG: hypothetical protein K6F86_05935 [Lachnospiraceae bacterium]|nr:hypothetical protein [Lachnospiraceae bacterium]